MKHVLILCVLFCCALAGFGAYQYNDYVSLNGTTLGILKSADYTLTFYSPIQQWETFTVQTIAQDGTVSWNTLNITGQTINIGQYTAGDNLRFFLTDRYGWTTMDNETFWGSGWNYIDDTYSFLHFGANYGWWGSQYTSQMFQITGASAPSGQPLPGVLATMLIGTGVLFAAGSRRKKKAA